jgi:NAD(P) transhydrogenase subunit alpha
MTGFVGALTVFVLALFVGWEVINRVPPTLHTPLMSGSNALSGITVIGSLILAGDPNAPLAVHVLAGVAVAFAMINVVGGFVVTHRMLGMFVRKGRA